MSERFRGENPALAIEERGIVKTPFKSFRNGNTLMAGRKEREAEREAADEASLEGDPRGGGNDCCRPFCYAEATVDVPIVVRIGPFVIFTRYKSYCGECAPEE